MNPCHGVVSLTKLTVLQLIKNVPVFHATRRLVTFSQGPATGPYPELDESTQYPRILFLSTTSILILPYMSTGCPKSLES
jgi:hypothetical protein